jgi:hypothetical protein
MPLLHFVGFSNVGKSFSVGFCFLKAECKEDYLWALKSWLDCFVNPPDVLVTDHENALINAASVLFPTTNQVLCIWHLNQNILKNCKPLFTEAKLNEYETFYAEWTNLIFLHSIENFENEYITFKNKWSLYPRAIMYIQQNVYPHKERFVAAYTSRFRHFGSISTSRAEGLNGQIKKYIVSSREDLLNVCKALKLAVELQINEINIMIEQQKIVNNHKFDSFFSKVKNKISVYALDMILEQLALERPLNDCRNSFFTVYGIPCAHRLDKKLILNEKLELEDFDLHWKLNPNSVETPQNQLEEQFSRIREIAQQGGPNVSRSLASILENVGDYSLVNNPKTSSVKGRPAGAPNNSVRRDPSGYEYVEREYKKFEFEKKSETLCVNLERYMQSHTYMDIMRRAQIEGITLTGFTQSMCSMMKKGKSCVKNPETVEWLINFLNS